MTEAEWESCSEPDDMYWWVTREHNSQRRKDHFCLAAASLVLPLIDDEDARRPFEWLAENVGKRVHHHGSMHGLFHGPGMSLYDSHNRREQSRSGRAVHVAFDFWANWYEYAIPNLYELMRHFPGLIPGDSRTFLNDALRDIFGNPFRPLPVVDPASLTETVRGVAAAIYADRTFGNLPVLADALQDAGCEDAEILAHLRGPGPHVRGCWALDLTLGKS